MTKGTSPGGSAVVAAVGAAAPASNGKEGGHASAWRADQRVEFLCEGVWWRAKVLSVSTGRGVLVEYLDSPDFESFRVPADSTQLRPQTAEWDEPAGVHHEDSSQVGPAQSSAVKKGRQSDASRPSVTSNLFQVCIRPEHPPCRAMHPVSAPRSVVFSSHIPPAVLRYWSSPGAEHVGSISSISSSIL